MVTDGILEAVNRMIDGSYSSEHKEAIEKVWDMLSHFDEDQWYVMTDKEKESWVSTFMSGTENEIDITTVSNKINKEKLESYLNDDMIIEFSSPEDCREYFNAYDGQDFKNVEEMKVFQGEYGFGVGEKWYHVNYDEALDIWNKDLKNLYIVKLEDGTWDCHFGKDEDGLVLAEEKEYPVEVYYTRLDANGSAIMEREICTNALELEEILKWLGKCNRVVEKLWDYDIQTCQEALYSFFRDAYVKVLESISAEMIREKDINVSESAKRLAYDMDKFSRDYDPYEYSDRVSGREEEHFEQLCRDISKGNVRHLVKWLEDIVEEDEIPENVQKAKDLLDRLAEAQKTNKKTALDEKIVNAGVQSKRMDNIRKGEKDR